MALYRTWEIFADHQAQGNDCYLGITRLAEIAGRATRTMEKNLASLCAKQLLIERAERKVFRRSDDGILHSRVVVVKDFGGLYALAHEYYEWTHANVYIPPNREMISLVEQEPHLVAKVRRFENYRRLLSLRLPGPVTLQREEDRWFTEYQPEQPSTAFSIEAGTSAASSKRNATPTKLSAKKLPKDLAKDSLKRINGSTTLKALERNSADSAVPSSHSFPDQETDGAENMQQQGRPDAGNRTEEQEDSPVRSSMPTASLPMQELSGAQDGISSSLQVRVLDQTTEGALHDLQPLDCAEAKSHVQPLPGPLLADSFLVAIAGPFGDQSPKGTRTRVRALLCEAHLSQPAEIVMCLLRAYVVARNTRTIRPEHCHPETGQVNRMPLFCAMVQRFVDVSRQEQWWESSWQQIEEELVGDDCLARWWSEHQHLVCSPFDRVFNMREGAQNQTDALLLDKTSETHPFTESVPSHRTHRQRLSQDGRTSTSVPGKTSALLSSAQLAQSDQYQCYIDALMAHYSASEALQEAR
jgi:hypothetical protein